MLKPSVFACHIIVIALISLGCGRTGGGSDRGETPVGSDNPSDANSSPAEDAAETPHASTTPGAESEGRDGSAASASTPDGDSELGWRFDLLFNDNIKVGAKSAQIAVGDYKEVVVSGRRPDYSQCTFEGVDPVPLFFVRSREWADGLPQPLSDNLADLGVFFSSADAPLGFAAAIDTLTRLRVEGNSLTLAVKTVVMTDPNTFRKYKMNTCPDYHVTVYGVRD